MNATNGQKIDPWSTKIEEKWESALVRVKLGDDLSIVAERVRSPKSGDWSTTRVALGRTTSAPTKKEVERFQKAMVFVGLVLLPNSGKPCERNGYKLIEWTDFTSKPLDDPELPNLIYRAVGGVPNEGGLAEGLRDDVSGVHA